MTPENEKKVVEYLKLITDQLGVMQRQIAALEPVLKKLQK